MSCEWYEIPVRVVRNGDNIVVPANKVENGDIVSDAGGCSYITTGFWPDDEEEISYLAINGGLDHWPAEFFFAGEAAEL